MEELLNGGKLRCFSEVKTFSFENKDLLLEKDPLHSYLDVTKLVQHFDIVNNILKLKLTKSSARSKLKMMELENHLLQIKATSKNKKNSYNFAT